MRGFGFLFLSVSLCLFCSQGAFGQAHTVAITVDDLPFASDALSAAETAHISEIPNRQLLNAFQVHHAPVTGFVIQKRVESLGSASGLKILQDWIVFWKRRATKAIPLRSLSALPWETRLTRYIPTTIEWPR